MQQQQQQQYLGKILPGMAICDRYGEKFGTVAHVYRHDPAALTLASDANRLTQLEVMEVKTGPFGLGRRLYIPNGFIQDVDQNSVILSKPADEVKQSSELRYKPSYLDQLH